MAITVAMREQVSQLYVALFGRAPDGEGLGYWVQQLDAGQSFANVADTMYATTPARAYFPSFYTNEETISSFYTNVLGRTADAEGLAFWTAKLNAAGATPGSVIAEMIDVVANYSGTDADGLTSQALFNNKTEVAQYYGEQNGTVDGATTVLSSVTATASTVDAAKESIDNGEVAGVNQGGTYTLTNSTDSVTGTSGNDTVIGDNVSTSAGDTIAGSSGTDTLKLFGNAVKPNFTGIEVVYLNGNTAGMDVSANADVTDLQLDDVATAQIYTIASTVTDVSVANMAATEVVDFAGNTVTALNVALNGNGTAAGANDVQIDFNSTAQTAVSFTTETKKSYVELLNTGAKIATVNIAGDQALSLESALTTVTTINAGTATGAVTIAGVGASNLTFTGGTGDDKIVMGATITASDTLTGGTGTDTLSVSDADTIDTAAEVANITGFETFEAAAADGTTYDLSKLGAKNTLTGLVVSGAATVTVSNINAATTGNIKITADTTTVLTATDFVSGGTSDTATITLDDSVAKTGSGIDVTMTYAFADVLNFVSKSDGSATKTVGGAEENSVGLTATDVEKIVITGDEALVLTTAAGTLPTEIDASGLTNSAAVSVDTDASAIVSLLVKGTAKNDTIDIDNTATVTSTLYLGGGTDTVTVDGGGTSAHTLIYTATELGAGDLVKGGASTVTLTSVAAGDTVTLNFSSAVEALLKSSSAFLSASSANVTIAGTTLGSTNNVAAAQAGGNMVFQIDLNGDGAYAAADDYQITLVGTGTDDTLVYNAANDYFVFTVV